MVIIIMKGSHRMENQNKKPSFKATVLITTVALLISLAASFISFNVLLANSAGKTLDKSVNTAKSAVEQFDTNLAYNTYLFTDKLYSTSNAVAADAPQAVKSDKTLAALARNLYLDSIIITDEKGNCVASYPDNQKGKNIADDKSTKKFAKILKGDEFKMQSSPLPSKDNPQQYSVTTAVMRTDVQGLVITNSKVDNYGIISGENITDKCSKNTIIIQNDKIISSSFDENSKITFEKLGFDKSKTGKGNFTLNIDGSTYLCTAQNADNFTVLCAVNQSELTQNAFSAFLITCIVDIIMIAVILLVAVIVKRKRQK